MPRYNLLDMHAGDYLGISQHRKNSFDFFWTNNRANAADFSREMAMELATSCTKRFGGVGRFVIQEVA